MEWMNWNLFRSYLESILKIEKDDWFVGIIDIYSPIMLSK